MRSIRNLDAGAHVAEHDFRSLGNALYPEHVSYQMRKADNFRSLGNALYPEHYF